MAGFIQNILWNSVEGFVEAGTRSVGQYAGDALIKAGDAIENTGRGVGDKIERSASAYGQKVSGQGYQGGSSGKALPSTALKPVVKRSNSMPATTKAPAKKSVPRGRTAAPKQITNGAGGTAAKSVTGVAQKAIMSGVSGAKSTVGGAQKSVTGGQKALTGPTQKTGAAASKTQSKPYPTNPPPSYAAATANRKPQNNAAQKKNDLPKPYPNTSASSTYPSGKKTAVKPGKPKPFVVENKALDGNFGKKTPVKPKPYGPTAEKGKVQHIPLSGSGGGGGGSQQKSTGGYSGPKTGPGGKMQHIQIEGLGSGGSTYGGSMKADKPAGGKFQHIAV